MRAHTHVDAFIPEFSAYCTPSLQIITQEHALPCHGKSCLVCGATPQLYRLLLETPTISMSIVSVEPDIAEEIMTLLLAGTAGLGSTCSPKRRKIQQMKSITCFLKFLMVHFCESAFSMVSKLARANFQIYMYMYIKKYIYMQCDY